MLKRNLAADLKYFIILLTLATFFLIPIANVGATSSSRWHAGYAYYGHSSGGFPPRGIMADIYCVSPSVPFGHGMFEWVSVITSYSPAYWVQVGYKKQYTWCFIFPCVLWSFYAERMDSTGFAQYPYGFPLSHHTYNFRIYLYTSGNYKWYIKEGSTHLYSGNLIMHCYTPIDLQACAETTTPSISIWTSHFSNIQYYDGRIWYSWRRHIMIADYPYVVQEISHYEFYAWRG